MRDWPPSPSRGHTRAVFLDRDGTVNVDTDYPHRLEDLTFEQGALAGLRQLADLPVAIVVVSNQAGIAKGLYTPEAMSAFNVELRRRVEANGGRIDAFYYCPELEWFDLPEGTTPSACSKPEPGMLLEAASELGLDLTRSFMIGDKRSDVEAGRRAGTRTILVLTGRSGEGDFVDAEPNFVAPDLCAAAGIVGGVVYADG